MDSKRRLRNPLQRLERWRMGTAAGLLLSCFASTGMSAEPAFSDPIAVKRTRVHRAVVRSAPEVPKRGRGLGGLVESGLAEQPPALRPGVAAPRREAYSGRPTPAAAPRPTNTYGGESTRVDQFPTNEAAERHVGPAADRTTSSEVTGRTPRRYLNVQPHRKPFSASRSPTMMRNRSESRHRLPHGFAARISSHGVDPRERTIPASREAVSSGEGMNNLSQATRGMTVGPVVESRLQRATMRRLQSVERAPFEQPAAKPVSLPISSFIIVAPAAGEEREQPHYRDQDQTDSRPSISPAEPRRLTVLAEYNVAPPTEAAPTSEQATVYSSPNQAPPAGWPFSAFTSARWRQGEASGAVLAIDPIDRGLRNDEINFAGGLSGLKEQVDSSSRDERDERAAESPAGDDHSAIIKKYPLRRVSLSSRIFRPTDRQRTPTSQVALHQSTVLEQAEQLGELVVPGAIASEDTMAADLTAGAPTEIRGIEASIELPTGQLPEDFAAERFREAGEVINASGATRSVAEAIVLWEAPVTSHRELVFEEPNLERHGHSVGIFQPILSAAHFFGRVPAMPYLMAAGDAGHCHYTLGHFRPGSCAPYQVYLPPLTLNGLTAEATSVLGMLYLIP